MKKTKLLKIRLGNDKLQTFNESKKVKIKKNTCLTKRPKKQNKTNFT